MPAGSNAKGYEDMKKKTKRILSIVLIVAAVLLVAAVFTIGRNRADEGYDLVKVEFERGALDTVGKYTETKGSIYTKEAFECGSEVRIKLDFDSNVTYQLFFYDENEDFVESSDELMKTTTVSAPDGAVYCRLVVTPEWDADVDEDDQIVRLWNVNKYAKQLTVMVAPVEEAE